MKITDLTLRTHGKGDARNGNAHLGLNIKIDTTIFEQAIINQLIKDEKFNYRNMIDPKVTNIDIVQNKEFYDLSGRICIGNGHYVNYIIRKFGYIKDILKEFVI